MNRVDIHASVPPDNTEAPTTERPAEPEIGSVPDSFPTPTVNTADLLKFLIDRTGYIKLLEDEDTPEAFSRIENLRELVNAAMDSRDRGETLDQFLDHAALVADADDYDERAQITLMSLHAAKGLEFPLVFLCGLEEGLFPHSRTLLEPDDIEEERRLCYVGMTRAMDQLILTRAVYRRRYGTDLPEASVPSRFLEEVPAPLFEELGTAAETVSHRDWSGLCGDGRPRPFGGAQPRRLPKAPITPTKTKTKAPAGVEAAEASPRPQSPPPRPNPTTPSRTSPSSSPAAARSSPPQNAGRRAHRQAWIPPRPEGPPSKIRRRHGLPARRRRRRCQDYGTIPSLRIEEAGGEVRPAGTRVARG